LVGDGRRGWTVRGRGLPSEVRAWSGVRRLGPLRRRKG